MEKDNITKDITKDAKRYLENPITGEASIYDPKTNTYKPKPSDLYLRTNHGGLKLVLKEEFSGPKISLDCKEVTFTVNGLQINIDITKFPKMLDNTSYIEINGIRFNREDKKDKEK